MIALIVSDSRGGLGGMPLSYLVDYFNFKIKELTTRH